MNLYLYLTAKPIPSYQIPGSVKERGRIVIDRIRSMPLPLLIQERMITRLVGELNHNADSTKETLDQFEHELHDENELLMETHKGTKWNLEVNDCLMGMSAWIILFDVLFEQVFDHGNITGNMTFGLSSILNALGLYLVCRALIWGIIRFDQGLKRWLFLGSGFVIFLALRYVARWNILCVQISVLAVLILFGIMFCLSLMNLNRFYKPKREERRIQ